MDEEIILQKQEDEKYIKRRRIVAASSLVIFILLLVACAIFVGIPLVRYLEEPEKFREWTEGNFWGRPAVVGIMILQVIVSLIPGGVVQLAAGYCYGEVEGGILCLIGAVIGSVIVFLFVKKFGVKLAEAFVSREKMMQLKIFQDTKRLNMLVFILYLIPGTPKDVFNYLVGLTPMKLGTFTLINLTARPLAIFMTTVVGNYLLKGEYLTAGVIFAVMMLLTAGGLLLYRYISSRKK